MLFSTLLFLFLAGGDSTTDSHPSDDEEKLMISILSDYDTDVRPLRDPKKALSITLKMIFEHFSVILNENQTFIYIAAKTLMSYDDFTDLSKAFDTVSKTFDQATDLYTITCRMAMMWRDEFLQWKPEDHNGVKRLQFDRYQIWFPQIYLYQTDVEAEDSEADYSNKCSVQFDGTTICIPRVAHVALCAPDARRWPYDEMNCTLRLGSWVNSEELIEYTLPDTPIILNEYKENAEWMLASTTAWKGSGNTIMFDKLYPSLYFSFILKRFGSTYTTMLLIPAIGFTLLTISSTFLAAGIYQIACAMVSLSAQMFYLIQIYWYVPSHGENLPYIVMFFRDSVVITTVTIFVSMFMMALIRFKHQPPNLVYTLINIAKAGPAKIVTFQEFDPDKEASSEAANGESGETLTKLDHQQSANSDWKNFATIFGRMFSYTITSLYILLICIYASS